jgi:iron complex outermembrane recepter protein
LKDTETNEPIVGATIIIKGKLTGTISDAKGNFELITTTKPPFILAISMIGYQKQEVEVNDAGQSISVSLVTKSELMNEMVFSASRVEENILQSPVSIEKMDAKSIDVQTNQCTRIQQHR